MLAVLAVFNASAQQSGNFATGAVVTPFNLEITTGKTTMIIFPATIQSADRGDRTVLAEKVKGTENVLKVKAAEKNVAPSNLHVITTDGKVYGFNVTYSDNPGYQTLDLRKQPPFAPVTFQDISLNSRQLADAILSVNSSSPFMHKRDKANDVEMKLEGIYLKADVMIFRFNLKNTSAISYEVGSLRFFVRDRKKMKRTSEQDREILPVTSKSEGLPQGVKGQTITVVFPKFTIAENKLLVTELGEKDGDRNLHLKLDERKLLKARSLDH